MYVIPNIEFIFQCRVRESTMYSNFMSIQVCLNAIVVTQMSTNVKKTTTKPHTIQPPSALLFRMLRLEGCWDAGYCSAKEPEVQQKLS